MNTAVNRLRQEFGGGGCGNGGQNENQRRYDLRDAVKLPDETEDPNEWIAHNLFDFHKQISMLYGTVSDECTQQSCPRMTAGRKHEYSWSCGSDTINGSASEYIEHLLDWVQEQLDDEETFPSMSVDKEFPPNIREICQTIARRLFRVYAHVYHHHLSRVKHLKEERHMNTSLKHFTYFIKEFDLVSDTDLDPLKNYIEKLEQIDIF